MMSRIEKIWGCQAKLVDLHRGLFLLILCIVVMFVPAYVFGQSNTIADPPQVRGPLQLAAARSNETGRMSFYYAGQETAPTIRVSPGEDIRIHYVNNLPERNDEECVLTPCMDMTNLHFHGLHVSPNAPQDDVLTMLAMPGQSLDYRVAIPKTMPPGLYWYHTHPHGESYRQVLDGMSGAIVIEGMDRYYPELRTLRERILVLRSRELQKTDPARMSTLRNVSVPDQPCGTSSSNDPERVFTVNGQLRPQIPLAEGERQFWRIVNASPDLYADLQVDGQQLEIVALDGVPLSFHDRSRRPRKVAHVLLPPAGRVEAIVTGSKREAPISLRSLCVDTGTDGDPNPEMVIADLAAAPQEIRSSVVGDPSARHGHAKPVFEPITKSEILAVERSPAQFTVLFTEDEHGFYINGKKFTMADAPMLTVKTGHYQHWRIINQTKELHPFHIHQVHFLSYQENGKRAIDPEWLDTVNVPYGGSADLVMDFTDPVIRGMSVFHCHLLKHEDKGMMAKILFK